MPAYYHRLLAALVLLLACATRVVYASFSTDFDKSSFTHSISFVGCPMDGISGTSAPADETPFRAGFASTSYCFPLSRFQRTGSAMDGMLGEAVPTISGATNCADAANALLTSYWRRLAGNVGGVAITDPSIDAIADANLCTDGASGHAALVDVTDAVRNNPKDILMRARCVSGGPTVSLCHPDAYGAAVEDFFTITFTAQSAADGSADDSLDGYSRCVDGLAVRCSYCEPYLEPESVAQPYTFLLFPGVQLILLVALDLLVFDGIAVRIQRRMARYERERPTPSIKHSRAFRDYIIKALLKGGRFRIRLRATNASRDGASYLKELNHCFEMYREWEARNAAIAVAGTAVATSGPSAPPTIRRRRTGLLSWMPRSMGTIEPFTLDIDRGRFLELCHSQGIVLQRALYAREAVVGCYRALIHKALRDMGKVSLAESEQQLVRRELDWFWKEVCCYGERMYNGFESNWMSTFKANWAIMNVPQESYHVEHRNHDTRDDMAVYLYCLDDEAPLGHGDNEDGEDSDDSFDYDIDYPTDDSDDDGWVFAHAAPNSSSRVGRRASATSQLSSKGSSRRRASVATSIAETDDGDDSADCVIVDATEERNVFSSGGADVVTKPRPIIKPLNIAGNRNKLLNNDDDDDAAAERNIRKQRREEDWGVIVDGSMLGKDRRGIKEALTARVNTNRRRGSVGAAAGAEDGDAIASTTTVNVPITAVTTSRGKPTARGGANPNPITNDDAPLPTGRVTTSRLGNTTSRRSVQTRNELREIHTTSKQRQTEYVVECEDDERIFSVIGNLYVLLQREGSKPDVRIDDICVVFLDGFIPPLSFNTSIRQLQTMQKGRIQARVAAEARGDVPKSAKGATFELYASLPDTMLPLRFSTKGQLKNPFTADVVMDERVTEVPYWLGSEERSCCLPTTLIEAAPEVGEGLPTAYNHIPTGHTLAASRRNFIEHARFSFPTFNRKDLERETDNTLAKLLDTQITKLLADGLRVVAGEEVIFDFDIRDAYHYRDAIPQLCDEDDPMAYAKSMGTGYADGDLQAAEAGDDNLWCFERVFHTKEAREARVLQERREAREARKAANALKEVDECIAEKGNEPFTLEACDAAMAEELESRCGDNDSTDSDSDAGTAVTGSRATSRHSLKGHAPLGGSSSQLSKQGANFGATAEEQAFEDRLKRYRIACKRGPLRVNPPKGATADHILNGDDGELDRALLNHQYGATVRQVYNEVYEYLRIYKVADASTTRTADDRHHRNKQQTASSSSYDVMSARGASSTAGGAGASLTSLEATREVDFDADGSSNIASFSGESVRVGVHRLFKGDVEKFMTLLSEMYTTVEDALAEVDGDETCVNRLRIALEYHDRIEGCARIVPIVTKEHLLTQKIFYVTTLALAWTVLYGYVFIAMCIYDVMKADGLTAWEQYESIFFRFVNSGVPISMIGTATTNWFVNADGRSASRLYLYADSTLLILSIVATIAPIVTHCITGAVLYIWMLIGIAIVLGTPNALLWAYYVRRRAKGTAPSVPLDERRSNHTRLKWLLLVILVWFQFATFVVLTFAIQSTYNWAHLFYRKNEMDLNYIGVIDFEGASRSHQCYVEESFQSVSQTFQWLSSFIG